LKSSTKKLAASAAAAAPASTLVQGPAPTDWAALGLLAVYLGALAFLNNVNKALILGQSAPTLWAIYKGFWTRDLAEAFLGAWALQWLKGAYFGQRQSFFPSLLLLFHAVALIVCSMDIGAAGWLSLSIKLGWGALAGGLALSFFAGPALEARAAKLHNAALNLAPWVALYVFVRVNGPIGALDAGLLGSRSLWWGKAAAATLLLTAAVFYQYSRPVREPGRILDILVIAVIFHWMQPWHLTYEMHHQSVYLAPVNDVMLGRNVLVDIASQYGIAPIYLLAGIFKLMGCPPSYTGLSAISLVLYMLQAIAIWMLLLRAMRSRVLAVLALATAVIVNRYWFPGQWDPTPYPAGGPIRFILPMVILMAAWWRHKKPGRSFNREMFFLGLASVWGLEVLVWTLGGYGAFTMVELWDGRSAAEWAKALGARIVQFLKWAVGAHLVLTLMLLISSHQLPNYHLYTDFLGVFGGGLMFRWPELDSAWLLLGTLPFFGFIACTFLALRGKAPANLPLVAGLCNMGAAQYSYFIMLAHPVNLRYLLIPTVLGGFYLLEYVMASQLFPRAARWAAGVAGISLGVVSILLAWPAVQAEGPAPGRPDVCCNGGMGYTALWTTLKNPPVLRPWSKEATDLMEKYMPGQKAVPIIIYSFDSTHAHLLSATHEIGPYSDTAADQWIMKEPFDQTLKAGDMIILDSQKTTIMDPLNTARYQSLKARFDLDWVECMPLGICAVRLNTLGSLSPTAGLSSTAAVGAH
jgi:hypothetical protein